MASPVSDPSEAARPEREPELIERTYENLLRAFFEAIGADLGVLVARNGDAGLRLLSMWERDQDSTPWAPEIDLLDRALLSDHALVHPPLTNGAEADITGAGEVRALAAPVRVADEVVGVLYAGFTDPPSLRLAEQLWMAESYAGLASLCMAGDHAISQVIGTPTEDSLTRCLNFGATMEVLSAELARAQRRGHALSCCFIDLDGFKRVNDSDGHLQGNRVLAAVGEALSRGARAYDSVGRFGGDEFVVVLPETDRHAAQTVAARLTGTVSTAIASVTGVQVHVSIGVAQWGQERSSEELLKSADAALLGAKQNGGNKVVASDGNGSASATGFGPLPKSPTEIFDS